MSDNQTGFDAEYVKKLREEAAEWRTKYRELESQSAYKDVSVELARRGVKADPSWIAIEDGQSIADAVESFVGKYPQLAATPQTPATTTPTHEKRTLRPSPPPVVTGSPNTNAANVSASGEALGERSVAEVKKDPVARAKLRDTYRALINAQNRTIE